jgi:hypothetical protein
MPRPISVSRFATGSDWVVEGADRLYDLRPLLRVGASIDLAGAPSVDHAALIVRLERRLNLHFLGYELNMINARRYL